MLIDLDHHGPITIDPSAYPETLAIQISMPMPDMDQAQHPWHQQCGVFAGRWDPFTPEEREQLVPRIGEEDFGRAIFLLARPSFEANLHMSYRWYYAAIGWDGGVYVGRPYGYEITLQAYQDSQESSRWNWSVSIDGERAQHLCIIMPNYQPGYGLPR